MSYTSSSSEEGECSSSSTVILAPVEFENLTNLILSECAAKVPENLCKYLFFFKLHFPLLKVIAHLDDQRYTKAVKSVTVDKSVELYVKIVDEYKKLLVREKVQYVEDYDHDFVCFALDRIEHLFVGERVRKGLSFGGDVANLLEWLVRGLNFCGGQTPCRSVNHYQDWSISK